MTGRRIDAEEAFRIGLVSEVVRNGDLLERAMKLAGEILQAPLEALRFVKGYLKDNANRGFEESFSVEHDKAFQEFLLTKAAEAARKK